MLALLLAMAGNSLAQSQPKPQPQSKSSPLSEQERPAQPAPASGVLTPQQIEQSITDGIEAAAKQYEANHPATPPDNSGWWFNFWLVIFTGGLVVVGAAQCYLIFGTLRAAQNSIDLARDDFNATHRPWISVTYVAISVGLSWAERNAVLGLNVFCKNTGNSPAIRVSLAATIFPFLTNDDIPEEMAKLQERHRTSTRRPIIERTLFPGAQDDLIIPRVLVIPEVKIASLKDGRGDPAIEMVPVILGSIEYYFSFGEREPHYTPFVFHLWRTAGNPTDRLTFRLDGSNVVKENMLLVELMSAGDAT